MALPFRPTVPNGLPAGYRLTEYDSIDSTNAEALRSAASGDMGGLWILAGEQLGGRGRAGRPWVSPPGNLYASLLLRPNCSATAAPGLSLLTAVAVREAIASMPGAGLKNGALRLKWPNDILLDGAKAGGILLESAGNAGRADYAIVIGIGLNVGQHPSGLKRSVANLSRLSPALGVWELFTAIAASMDHWLTLWRNGDNFAAIRDEWLKHAHSIGSPVSVLVNGTVVDGVFLGLDESGALRLGDRGAGGERRVTAGDVFF